MPVLPATRCRVRLRSCSTAPKAITRLATLPGRWYWSPVDEDEEEEMATATDAALLLLQLLFPEVSSDDATAAAALGSATGATAGARALQQRPAAFLAWLLLLLGSRPARSSMSPQWFKSVRHA